MHGFSGLEGVSGVIQRKGDFGGLIEEKVSDLGGLEGLEGLARLEMHGFSGLRSSDAGADFGGPIEEKVSDLGGLEGLEGLEMHGFSGLEGVSDSAHERFRGPYRRDRLI